MERNELVSRIDRAVEELHQELVDFACEIFAIPTQNPPGYNYDKCTKAIGNMMEKIGMDVEYVSVPEERLGELAHAGQGLPRMPSGCSSEWSQPRVFVSVAPAIPG